jgi:DNA-binding FadR family transcriptional regulator
MAARLQDYITRKGLGPGDALPVRTTLARELNVGPRRLREGLSVLAYHGLIETRSKAGTIIREPSTESLAGPMEWHFEAAGCDGEDLLRARAAMEGAAAWEAATRRTPRDLLVLLDALDALKQRQLTARLDLDEEEAFHRAILRAANNPAMMIMEQVTLACLNRSRANPPEEHDPARSNAEHEQIYQAIEQQNPRSAMERTYNHILARHGG